MRVVLGQRRLHVCLRALGGILQCVIFGCFFNISDRHKSERIFTDMHLFFFLANPLFTVFIYKTCRIHFSFGKLLFLFFTEKLTTY